MKNEMPRNRTGRKALKNASRNSAPGMAVTADSGSPSIRRNAGLLFYKRVSSRYHVNRAAQKTPFLLFLRLLKAGTINNSHHQRWSELTERYINLYFTLYGPVRKQKAKEGGKEETTAYTPFATVSHAGSFITLQQKVQSSPTAMTAKKPAHQNRMQKAMPAGMGSHNACARMKTGKINVRGIPRIGKENKWKTKSHASRLLTDPATHRRLTSAYLPAPHEAAAALRWRENATAGRKNVLSRNNQRVVPETVFQSAEAQVHLNKTGRGQKQSSADPVDSHRVYEAAQSANGAVPQQGTGPILRLQGLHQFPLAIRLAPQESAEQDSFAGRIRARSIMNLQTGKIDHASRLVGKSNTNLVRPNGRIGARIMDERSAASPHVYIGTGISYPSRNENDTNAFGRLPALTLKQAGPFADKTSTDEKDNDRKEAVSLPYEKEHLTNKRYVANKTDGDYSMIADRVYQIIERKITIERDRRGLS